MEQPGYSDPEYEQDRQAAERKFLIAVTEWREGLIVTIPKTQSTSSSAAELAVSAFVAGLRGEPAPPEPESRECFKWQLATLTRLEQLCRDYAEAELTAFVGLLSRRGLPPSVAVAELDKHVQALIVEIDRKKWDPHVTKEFFDESVRAALTGSLPQAIKDSAGYLETRIWISDAEVWTRPVSSLLAGSTARASVVEIDAPDKRKALGRRLADARKSKGLTQEQAAECVGIAVATLQSHELGRRTPDTYTLKVYARKYDVDLSCFQ